MRKLLSAQNIEIAMTATSQALDLFTGVIALCAVAYLLGRIASHKPADSSKYRRKWMAVRREK